MQPGAPEEEWREDCAPRRVLELFATKWTSMVLHTLQARHRRRGADRRAPAQPARHLQEDADPDAARHGGSGLVTRHVQGSIPPAVEYRLTRSGSAFVEPVELLYAWGRDNADALDQLGSRSSARRT